MYDTLNPYDPDAQPGFYAGLAAELGVTSILDLGCGTGLITCALARLGHRMIGVEPAPGLLAQARADRAGNWSGGSTAAPSASARRAPTWPS